MNEDPLASSTANELELETQFVSKQETLPEAAQLLSWAQAAMQGAQQPVALLVRIVDEAESAQLNEGYRGKPGPTNVLSFPFEVPESALADFEVLPLGDLVICAPVVAREAVEQGKQLWHHWAHMVVHGVLHLRGYDHINDQDAFEMETFEVQILHSLQIPDPYQPPESSGCP